MGPAPCGAAATAAATAKAKAGLERGAAEAEEREEDAAGRSSPSHKVFVTNPGCASAQPLTVEASVSAAGPARWRPGGGRPKARSSRKAAGSSSGGRSGGSGGGTNVVGASAGGIGGGIGGGIDGINGGGTDRGAAARSGAVFHGGAARCSPGGDGLRSAAAGSSAMAGSFSGSPSTDSAADGDGGVRHFPAPGRMGSSTRTGGPGPTPGAAFLAAEPAASLCDFFEEPWLWTGGEWGLTQ